MTYDEVYYTFKRLMDHKTDQVLACVNEKDKLVGVLGLYTEIENKYLMFKGGVYAQKDYEQISLQFVEYLRISYPGFELYMGYLEENKQGNTLAQKLNAKLIDKANVMELKKDDYIEKRFKRFENHISNSKVL